MIGLLALAAALSASAPALPTGQSHYTLACGGCHGLLGVSARREIPVLRDHVGSFLCSAEGREYVVRLPNVAFAVMDDATLATALNFMVFGLGGASVPSDDALARPYSAREVAVLRARPLKARDLARLRDEALAKSAPGCGVRAAASSAKNLAR